MQIFKQGMNSPSIGNKVLRWFLSLVDGLLFGWFLIIGYLATRLLLRMSESQIEIERWPLLTQFTRIMLPEHAWSILPGSLCFGLGFGLISFNSCESSASRIFRWAIILGSTFFIAASIPAIEGHLLLNGSPEDEYLFDEVLYLCLGLAMLVFGVFQVRRHTQNRCP